jgi:hypothetical protein
VANSIQKCAWLFRSYDAYQRIGGLKIQSLANLVISLSRITIYEMGINFVGSIKLTSIYI